MKQQIFDFVVCDSGDSSVGIQPLTLPIKVIVATDDLAWLKSINLEGELKAFFAGYLVECKGDCFSVAEYNEKFNRQEPVYDAQNNPESQFDGFYKYELELAFQKVQNKKHWKDPIDSFCTTDEARIIAAAISFFTATNASFDYIGVCAKDDGRFKAGEHLMKVRADGYRRGPAGDH